VGAADGVDWRQVEDVEAHGGDLRQKPLDVAELAHAAREELVPGAVARLDGLDQHLELAPVRRHVPLRVAVHELEGNRVHVGLAFAKRLRQSRQARGVAGGAVGPLRGGLDHARPGLELDLDVLSGVEPLGKLPAPGPELVDPTLDGVDVAAELGHGELTPPAVVDQRRHRHGGPLARPLVPEEQRGREGLVAVAEDARLHGHRLPDDAPGREPAAVDLGRDCLDDDPFPAVGWEVGGLRPARGRTFGTPSSGGHSGHAANRAMIRQGAEIHRSGYGPGARDLPRGRRVRNRDRPH